MALLAVALLASNDGLTKSFSWYEGGVRAVPFARAIPGKYGLLE